MLLFTFDDGGASQYSEAFAYMESKGLHKATVYVYAGMDQPGYLSWAQAAEMYAAGWDIANHDGHTDLTTLTQGEIETALTTEQGVLEARGLLRGSRHVAYPFGGYNATVDAAMTAAGMLTGRLASGLNFDPTTPPSLYQLPSIAISTPTSAGQAQAAIYEAVKCGRVLILQFHGLQESPSNPAWSIADFRALVDWVAERGYTLSTISELYARLTA